MAGRQAYDARLAGCLCDECPLRSKRPVGPEGPADADLVIVGEAPGPQEEVRGRPFIGPSGMMLDDLLQKAGTSRDRVFITNALCCRSEVPGETGQGRVELKRYMAWLRTQNVKIKREWKQLKKAGPAPLIKSPFDCCRPRLLAELRWFEDRARDTGRPNGAVVVPVGNYALTALSGKAGIMKYRGAPLEASSLVDEMPSLAACYYARGSPVTAEHE